MEAPSHREETIPIQCCGDLTSSLTNPMNGGIMVLVVVEAILSLMSCSWKDVHRVGLTVGSKGGVACSSSVASVLQVQS